MMVRQMLKLHLVVLEYVIPNVAGGMAPVVHVVPLEFSYC